MADSRSPERLRARHGVHHASTIINVAVPDMSRVFALGQERVQWLSAGFMAAMTISMLLTPWLLARFGYRLVCCAAVLLPMPGGLGGGFGWRFDWVLAMRVRCCCRRALPWP